MQPQPTRGPIGLGRTRGAPPPRQLSFYACLPPPPPPLPTSPPPAHLIELDAYGLGSARSLQSFEDALGVSFRGKRVMGSCVLWESEPQVMDCCGWAVHAAHVAGWTVPPSRALSRMHADLSAPNPNPAHRCRWERSRTASAQDHAGRCQVGRPTSRVVQRDSAGGRELALGGVRGEVARVVGKQPGGSARARVLARCV